MSLPGESFLPQREPWGKTDLLLIACVVLFALVAFAQAHRRAMHPIIDSGRDLYLPSAMVAGNQPYRDFRYNYPPVSPYLLAGIVRLFGNSLSVYEITGAAVGVGTAAILYALARLLAGPFAAGACALLFAANSFASHTNHNFIYPYAHAATFGVFWFIAFLYTLITYLFVSRRVPWFAATLFFALLAAWTKLEFAAGVALVAIVAVAIHRLSWRATLITIGSAAGSLALVSIAFMGAPHHWLRDNVLSRSLISGPAARFFALERLGLDHPWTSILQILMGAGVTAAVVLVLRGSDEIHSGPMRKWLDRLFPWALGAGAIFIRDDIFFRGWSLLLPVLLAWVASRDRKGPLLLVLIAAIGCAIRIPLNLAPRGYGFVLLIPTYVAISSVLLRYLPSKGLYSATRARVWLCFLAGISLGALYRQHLEYGRAQFPIRTRQGVFYDSSRGRAEVLNRVLAWLEARRPATLAVFPEGISINYLSSIRSPLYYYMFTPVETADERIESDILRDLEARRPEAIAMVTRPVTEYGSRGFGVDYNRRVLEWIGSNYVLEQAWDASAFEAQLYRRRDTPGNVP